jgi:PIN domain nuclease of toxin-antitoxin system
MKLLLDTHIVIWAIDRTLSARFPAIAELVTDGNNTCFVSAASLWEINLKQSIGKLEIDMKLSEIPDFLESHDIFLVGITAEHAVAEPNPLPPTRNPFDRLLLAQAQIEGMRFVTVDRALADHPVTFR